MSDDKDLILPEVQERYTNDLNRTILWTMGGSLFLRNSSPESMFFGLVRRFYQGVFRPGYLLCSFSTTRIPFY